MSRPRSILLAAAGLMAALAVVVLFVLPRIVHVDSFRPQLEARLSSALGRPVTLGALRLSIGLGIAFDSDGLRIAEPTPGMPGATPTFEARAARVRVALLPLLRHRLVARSFVLDDGTARSGSRTLVSNVRVAGRLDAAPAGEVRSNGSITGRVSALPGTPQASLEFAVALREGRLIVEAGSAAIGPGTLEGRGEITGLRTDSVHARLEGSGGIGDSRCEGTVEGELRDGAPEMRFELTCPSVDVERIFLLTGGGSPARGLALHRVAARGELRDGALRCTDATFELFGGEHRGGFALRPFEETVPFELDSHLAALSVARLCAAVAPEHAATLEGTGDLDLALHGHAPGGRVDASSLTGTARLVLRDGKLASVGVLRQIGRLLENTGGRGIGPEDTPFRSMSATFQVQAGSGRTDDLAVRSDDLDVDGHGIVRLEGSLDLDLVASFSRGASEALVERNPKVRFRVGPDGRLSVPLKMAGSLTTPEVRLDVDRVLSEGVERILEEKKKGLWKKLFGGR